VKAITSILFLDPSDFPSLPSFDLLFVFGGSHPQIWETAAQAYHEGRAKQVLVTGGYKPNATRHSSWNYGTTPEAHVIRDQLIRLGVPKDVLIIEDRSTNSLENVLFAKKTVDFNRIQSVLFASKSFASGRQYRTLLKHLPPHLVYRPLIVHSTIGGRTVTRDGWINDPQHRQIVFGEYLRILHYGKKGDLVPLENPIPI